MTFTINDYLSLVESQHKPRPKFMAILRKYLEMGMSAQENALNIENAFSLENAIGAQLDIIGQLVGVSRNYPYIEGSSSDGVMSDDQYRLVIRATIARNRWDGSFHSFADTWNEVFAGLPMTAAVRDNMDMSCTVTVSGDFDDEIAALIVNGYVFPKPMGVQMTYEASPQGDRTASADMNAAADVPYITAYYSAIAQ